MGNNTDKGNNPGMDNNQYIPLVLKLDDVEATIESVGGKGASLARLARAGLPVPAGFHITTAAYRRFVEENRIQEQILAAASRATADRPGALEETSLQAATFQAATPAKVTLEQTALEEASRQIEQLFADGTMPEEIARAISRAYADLGRAGLPAAVAVRSSATAEDLPGLSFAGQQESYLNIRGGAEVLEAVRRCWASLWTARAIGYRALHGIAHRDVSLAVVVQELVPADAAVVLFTANPLTGRRDQELINAAWGLGEAIVAGRVTPDTFLLDKESGKIVEQRINQKTTMTTHTMTACAREDTQGTQEIPVPPDQRGRAALAPKQAARLARLGIRIEELYGRPMDIEWALHEGCFYIVQARPITALPGCNPQTGEWNDSLAGDYLWTNSNLGEAVPDVMTPCTWSLVRIFMADAMATSSIAPFYGYGNIAGRFYLNLSVAASLAAIFGVSRKQFAGLTRDVFGRLPEGLEIPPARLSRWRALRKLLPVAFQVLRRTRKNQQRVPAFLAGAPGRCEALHARIRATSSTEELSSMWQSDVAPLFHECNRMLEAAGRGDGSLLIRIRSNLQKLVGEADANALLTGLNTGAGQLASLGPLIGLTRLAGGEIDRAAFARLYGHRGPHELEVSIPRPAEDQDWIDKQLAGLRQARENMTMLLDRQASARAAAWERFRRRYPRKEATVRQAIDRWVAVARNREAARSEVVRAFWMLRRYVQQAGRLTGQGEAIFFLSIEEILDLLGGDRTALAHIPARQDTYQRYAALPPYPSLIRGRFDPFQWAADPRHRSDLFVEGGASVAASGEITGFPGATGVVEGRVRVILKPEDGDQLQNGEILVTSVTNIGWTPLFPRAGAIVTDIGAPLSHAAIVARELGIPAVIGCGNATMRLQTGDLVQVDGAQGTVKVLQPAATGGPP